MATSTSVYHKVLFFFIIYFYFLLLTFHLLFFFVIPCGWLGWKHQLTNYFFFFSLQATLTVIHSITFPWHRKVHDIHSQAKKYGKPQWNIVQLFFLLLFTKRHKAKSGESHSQWIPYMQKSHKWHVRICTDTTVRDSPDSSLVYAKAFDTANLPYDISQHVACKCNVSSGGRTFVAVLEHILFPWVESLPSQAAHR